MVPTLQRGCSTLSLADSLMEAELDVEKEKRRKEHRAGYMRFWRSLESPLTPPEVVAHVTQVKQDKTRKRGRTL